MAFYVCWCQQKSGMAAATVWWVMNQGCWSSDVSLMAPLSSLGAPNTNDSSALGRLALLRVKGIFRSDRIQGSEDTSCVWDLWWAIWNKEWKQDKWTETVSQFPSSPYMFHSLLMENSRAGAMGWDVLCGMSYPQTALWPRGAALTSSSIQPSRSDSGDAGAGLQGAPQAVVTVWE